MSAAEFCEGMIAPVQATPGKMARIDGGGESFESTGDAFDCYPRKRTAEETVRAGRNAEDVAYMIFCDEPPQTGEGELSERGAVELEGEDKPLRVFSVVNYEMWGVCVIEAERVV